MFLNNIGKILNKLKDLAKDPLCFLENNLLRYRQPKGFRIELFIAIKYNSIRFKLRQLKCKNHRATGSIPESIKRKTYSAINSEKIFCPYCEKTVVPKRLHKLDVADIILVLLTAGLWAIFLFVMYIFIRRCPVCNYNLRGFKFLSDKKRR